MAVSLDWLVQAAEVVRSDPQDNYQCIDGLHVRISREVDGTRLYGFEDRDTHQRPAELEIAEGITVDLSDVVIS